MPATAFILALTLLQSRVRSLPASRATPPSLRLRLLDKAGNGTLDAGVGDVRQQGAVGRGLHRERPPGGGCA